jgi:chromosome segregation protein
MQLNSLSISGFKSFAKPTTLTFAPGITCVVGPNGCGKSNVVDAIRWVLGEQRSSVLRSERMDNVIFNGTVSRKGAGIAEVRLVMDNSKGVLNVPYAEVEIARRLHRDGTSEYMLNGNECRLKDISDMLHDSGMGPNLYTILELKMVEEILREDGEGRRALFEEAAGVAKYKLRRRQALLKLKQTEDDLLRLNDIVTEVERQVSSLKRQALRAKRYMELSAQMKAVETALVYRTYVRLRDELAPLEMAIRETSAATEAAKAAVRREEALVMELRTTEIEIEREATEARKSLSAVVAEISTMEADEAKLRAREQSARDTIDRSRRERLMLTEKREVLQERLQDVQRVRAMHLEELAQSEAALASVVREFEKAENLLRSIELRSQEHQELVTRLRREFADRQKEHGQIIVRQAGLISRRELLQLDREALDHERAAAQHKLTALAEQWERVTAEESQMKTEESSAASSIEEAQTQLQLLDERSRQLASLVDSLDSKLELLATLEQQGPRSDRALRTLKEKHLSGLLDLLGDTVDVDDVYRRAFQAALGPAAYCYLTDSVDSALTAIETLRKETAGQAMFVSLAEYKTNGQTPIPAPGGAVGMALDLVKNGSANAVTRELLGRVAVVQDWNAALSLRDWSREHRATVVTLDGQWLNGTGMLRGGSEETKTTIDIGLGKQISELRQRLNDAQNERETLQTAIRKARVDLSSAEQAMATIRHGAAGVQEKRAALRDQQVKFETLISSLQSRDNNAHIQLTDIERELTASRSALNEAQQAMDSAETAMTKTESSSSELNAELVLAKSQLDRQKDMRHEAERGRDAVQHRIELSDADISRMTQTLTEIAESVSVAEKNGEDAANEIVGLEQRLNELEAALIERFRRRDELAQSTDKVSVRLDEVRQRIMEQEEHLRHERDAQAGELEGERRIELEIARLKGEIDALLNNARTQYGLEISAADFPAQHRTELEAEATPETFQDLKQRIERLGPINLVAIEEYEQENARLELMLKQREDLLKAKQTLQDTIVRINETAQASFLHTFEAVREHFQRLFQEFFVAGEADLILSGSDLLEADITLWANPSGKRLKSMSLMSGGEKTMTAIALLFALYQVKPSPFCVFDEVDAPLDDANIDRFNRVIRMHSEHTQFILVTHNRRTMEIADNLYGVTMEEEGISKIVSVRLLSAVA